MKKQRKIFETRAFSKEIANLISKHSLSKEDYDRFRKELAEYPDKAPVLTGTGGVRKARLKSSSRGKSGGFRVCYLYYTADEEIYLLFIFQKNEQENLTVEQRESLKDIVKAIKEMK